MAQPRFPTRRICAPAYRDGLERRDVTPMDFVYLLLLAALAGLTGGYLWLCARLEDRR